MAKVDCSGLPVSDPAGTFAGGTGMYVDILDALDCFWMACSAMGPSVVWMLTARPLKQGIAAGVEGVNRSQSFSFRVDVAFFGAFNMHCPSRRASGAVVRPSTYPGCRALGNTCSASKRRGMSSCGGKRRAAVLWFPERR